MRRVGLQRRAATVGWITSDLRALAEVPPGRPPSQHEGDVSPIANARAFFSTRSTPHALARALPRRQGRAAPPSVGPGREGNPSCRWARVTFELICDWPMGAGVLLAVGLQAAVAAILVGAIALAAAHTCGVRAPRAAQPNLNVSSRPVCERRGRE